MKSIGRIFAVVLRQYYLLRGSLTRFMPIFVWITIDVILWGFMTRYLSGMGFNLAGALLGAVLLWGFFIRVMQGTTMAFFEDVWSRNFLNMFASPISVGEYVAGLIISAIATSALGLAAMLLAAVGIFGLPLFSHGAMLAVFLFILFLFGIALGIVGCAVVLRFGPASEWFVWPMPALMSPFAGVFYPLSALPEWMQYVSLALPPAYVFEGVRAVMSGGPSPLMPLFIGGGLAVFYIALAFLWFTHIYRGALKTGRIARYSAENTA